MLYQFSYTICPTTRFGNPDENISCIAKNSENYIKFGKKIVVGKYTDKEGNEKDLTCELKFVDSFRFSSSSLEALVKKPRQIPVQKSKEIL